MQEHGYSLVERLGVGNFALVSVVRDHATGKEFVIKELELKGMEPSDIKGAHQEVQLLATFDHPCIVSLKESFLDDELHTLNLVMEYCSGGDLGEVIDTQRKRNESFTEQQIMEYFGQLVLALSHMHSRNVLHRDLKAKNVFITTDNRLKLGDLGIAKVLNSSTELARTVIGTPYYLSPEICEGKPYDDKSDVWALGCIMYELATLQRAFDGRTLPALVVKILSGKYPPVPTQYSPELRRMIASMLQLDPDQRPSMSTLLEESVIADAVAELGLEAYLFMDKDTSPIAFPDEDEDQDSEDRGRSPNQLGLTKWSSDINGDIDDIMNDLAGLASPSSNGGGGPSRASPGRAPAATSSSTRAASSSSAAAHLTPKQSNRGKNGGRYHARQPSRSKRPLQSPVSAPGPAPVYDTIKSPLQQMITNQDAAQRKKQFLKDRREKREAKKKAEEDRIRAHKKKLQSIKSSVGKSKKGGSLAEAKAKARRAAAAAAAAAAKQVKSPAAASRKPDAFKTPPPVAKKPTAKSSSSSSSSTAKKRSDLKSFIRQQRKQNKQGNSGKSNHTGGIEILEGPKVKPRRMVTKPPPSAVASSKPIVSKKSSKPVVAPAAVVVVVQQKKKKQQQQSTPVAVAAPIKQKKPSSSSNRLKERIRDTRLACEKALGTELFLRLYNYVKSVRHGETVDENKVREWCDNDGQLAFLCHIHRLVFCEERFLSETAGQPA